MVRVHPTAFFGQSGTQWSSLFFLFFFIGDHVLSEKKGRSDVRKEYMGAHRTGVCPTQRQRPCQHSFYNYDSPCGQNVREQLEDTIRDSFPEETNERRRCKRQKVKALSLISTLKEPCNESDKAELEQKIKDVKCNQISDGEVWGLYQVVVTAAGADRAFLQGPVEGSHC